MVLALIIHYLLESLLVFFKHLPWLSDMIQTVEFCNSFLVSLFITAIIQQTHSHNNLLSLNVILSLLRLKSLLFTQTITYFYYHNTETNSQNTNNALIIFVNHVYEPSILFIYSSNKTHTHDACFAMYPKYFVFTLNTSWSQLPSHSYSWDVVANQLDHALQAI